MKRARGVSARAWFYNSPGFRSFAYDATQEQARIAQNRLRAPITAALYGRCQDALLVALDEPLRRQLEAAALATGEAADAGRELDEDARAMIARLL